MKTKLLAIVFILSVGVLFNSNNTYSQDENNPLLEYFTGTWCIWCPCGHTIVNNILLTRPYTVVIGYHGPVGQDPYSYFNGNSIISLMGISSWPSGVVNRYTGILDRGSWSGWVNVTHGDPPGVRIGVNNYTFNAGTRTINAQIVATSISPDTLFGNYNITYVITEDNLVYGQSGNSSCPGGSNYIHKNVARTMTNGATGERIVTGNWLTGVSVNRTFSHVLDASWVPANCTLIVFVSKDGGNMTTQNRVQQATKMSVTVGPVGILTYPELPESYSLSQNYPNPFNPTTNIHFTLPKNGNITLKIYDVLGNEVATWAEGFFEAGTYNADIDGTKWASGVYFYRLVADGFTETKRMSLVK